MGIRRGTLTKDIGHTGLQESWGYIRDDFLNEWNGLEKVRRIDEMMRNSPEIAALRLAIEMMLRGIDWEFVSDDGEDDPRLELLNDARENMGQSWSDHVTDALLFVFYGWSLFSITYERVGGRLLWKKFKPLGHDTIQRWIFADDGGLAGVQQWPHLWPEPIPIERLLLYRFRKPKNNPEGESILRPAWPSWYYVKNLQQIEAIGIERNLAGLPVIRPPMGADMTSGSTDRTTAEAVVRNIRNDEQAGIVLPPATGPGDENRWVLELLSGGGASKVIDTDIVIRRYTGRIVMSALAQFLILGQENVGSLALSQDQTSFFSASVNALADNLAQTFTKYAAGRLLELNGFDVRGIRLDHSPAGDSNLATVAAFLQGAGGMLSWTTADEQWLRSIARMPDREDDAPPPAATRTAEQPQQPQPPAQRVPGADRDEPIGERLNEARQNMSATIERLFGREDA